mmetsp:Transcript_19329/g.40706  ORF Transcript_19329/g.40706 Transcript_19329/m.40706 type:complete len:98 (-) Transcript_19329:3181-3474(-)
MLQTILVECPILLLSGVLFRSPTSRTDTHSSSSSGNQKQNNKLIVGDTLFLPAIPILFTIRQEEIERSVLFARFSFRWVTISAMTTNERQFWIVSIL